MCPLLVCLYPFLLFLKHMEGRWDKEMCILKVLITFNIFSLCVQGGYDVYVLVLWILIRMCVRQHLNMCTCTHARVQHQLSILLYCLSPFFFKVNLELRVSELQGLSCVPSTGVISVLSHQQLFMCAFWFLIHILKLVQQTFY